MLCPQNCKLALHKEALTSAQFYPWVSHKWMNSPLVNKDYNSRARSENASSLTKDGGNVHWNWEYTVFVYKSGFYWNAFLNYPYLTIYNKYPQNDKTKPLQLIVTLIIFRKLYSFPTMSERLQINILGHLNFIKCFFWDQQMLMGSSRDSLKGILEFFAYFSNLKIVKNEHTGRNPDNLCI